MKKAGYNPRESCFVIMPYGIRAIDGKQVDFDWIYEEIFKPAIRIKLESGRFLKARRADKEPKSGAMRRQMQEQVLRSRMALADITGNNPNVHHEIGLRYASKRSSTAIVMQPGTEVPHNLMDDFVVEYEFNRRSKPKRHKSIADIRDFLKRSIPPQGVGPPESATDDFLALFGPDDRATVFARRFAAAEKAAADGRIDVAIKKYRQLEEMSTSNPLVTMRLATLYSQRPEFGSQQAAQALFEKVSASCSNYSDAHRELGLAQNRIYVMKGRPEGIPTGETALRTAATLSGQDPKTLHSLANILVDKGDYRSSKSLIEGVGKLAGAESRIRDINHLIRGGLELDVTPISRRAGSTVYDFSLRNLPRETHKSDVERLVSPYGVKNLHIRSMPEAGTVNAVGRITSAGFGTVDQVQNRFNNQEIFGRRVVVNTTQPGGFTGTAIAKPGSGGKGGGGFGGSGF